MRIEIETDGSATNTRISINGYPMEDLASFGFFIKEKADRCKLQIKRLSETGLDPVTNLFGPEIQRYSEDIDRQIAILKSTEGKEP